MGFFSINKEVFPIGINIRRPIRETKSDSKLNLLLLIKKLLLSSARKRLYSKIII